MKKILLGFLVLMTTFVSCTDQEDIEIAYQSQVSVSAAHLFDKFTPVINEDDFSLNKEGNGEWNLNLHMYIYNEQGALIQKEVKSYNSLLAVLTSEINLIPGKYTIISIAEFSGVYADNNYKFWNISNENTLRDLKIEEADKTLLSSPFETLGVDTREITINNKSSIINIDIQPITGLVEIIVWDDDLTGTIQNGFSSYAPYINDIEIYASQLKQVVRFNGTNLEYEYNSQSTSYMVYKHNPLLQVEKKGAKQVFGYRAFLPIEDRDFFWELNCLPGTGQYLFTDKKDHQVSDKTTTLTINSGKQYVMDLVLDALYLWIEDFNANKGMFERLQEHLKDYNSILIKKALDKRYDKYVGMDRSTIETYLNKESWYTTETTTNYWGDGLISFITARFTDSTMEKSNRIMLTWAISTDAEFNAVTEVLSEMYTPWEKGSTENIKQFINGTTLNEATVGISWDIHNKCLYFDAIK